jgi:hypothetical protein
MRSYEIRNSRPSTGKDLLKVGCVRNKLLSCHGCSDCCIIIHISLSNLVQRCEVHGPGNIDTHVHSVCASVAKICLKQVCFPGSLQYDGELRGHVPQE